MKYCNHTTKKTLSYLFFITLCFASSQIFAASEDGGQLGVSINWGIVIMKMVGSLISLSFGVAGLWVGGVPLVKRATAESNGAGHNVPWVKPMLLGIVLCAIAGGVFALVLNSAHITENSAPLKIQNFNDTSSTSS